MSSFIFNFLDYRLKGSMTDMIQPCKNEVLNALLDQNVDEGLN